MEGLEDIIELFKSELEERLSRVESELVNNSGKDIELIYREFHTIKGTAQMIGFENYSKAAHIVEDVVKPLWKQNMSLPKDFLPRLLKVIDIFRSGIAEGEDLSEEDLKRIESILKGEKIEERKEEAIFEIVSEIDPFIVERALELSEEVQKIVFLEYSKDKVLSRLVGELRSTLRDLYWNTRTVSLKDVIKGFDRLVYEEAVREGKKVRFVSRVENVRVSKDVSGPIRDSLVHIVKNAVVHGIEPPDVRRKKGKPEEGTVELGGKMIGKTIEIRVSDDGAGIDLEKIRKKLESMGERVPENDEDLLKVIFEPFFSTRERADLGGGRGVGLSSVKDFLESIDGEIEVRSEKDRGTTFILKIPSGRAWAEVSVFRKGLFTFALRNSDIERIVLDEFGPRISTVSGKSLDFDIRVGTGEYMIIENPFKRLEEVMFWIDFVGIPVPVIKP